MRIRTRTCALLLAATAAALGGEPAACPWNQFRGPNGQGIAADARIPVAFGPEKNVRWKIAVGAGHSSPIVWGDKIFLTAAARAEKEELSTLAVDRRTGAVLWRKTVTPEAPGRFHALNNAASSTPAADSARIYVYFGTYGLLCYDHAGSELWQRRLPPPESKYGAGASPIVYKNLVILVLDGDGGASRMLAVDGQSGATAWDRPRGLFKAGWSTPMIFRHDETDELVVLGSKRLTAYALATGEELWWAGGFSDETVGVPVTGEGLLFAGAAALGGRGDEKLDAAATWKTTIAEFDTNHDNQIQREEMTPGFAFIQRPDLPKDNPGYGLPISDMGALLGIFDHDRNGVISEKEWLDTMAGFEALSAPALVAFRPGAAKDARPAHVAWETRRGIPETPSLLCHRGRLYLVRDGGQLTCLKAASGEELFRERLGAPGQHIASPIAAGEHVLFSSTAGVVTVIRASDALQVAARNELGEQIYATPALADGALYVRTAKHLFAFGD
jgi:outer membrane protein assembly factor BamB